MRTLINVIGATLGLIAVSGALAQSLSPEGEGRRAYLKYNCYGCHGMGAAGNGAAPNIIGKEVGDVREKVLKGGDGMLSYSAVITPAEITNLAAYLRSIGTKTEPKFNDWWVAVPTK
jgi:cytochrome c551